MLAFFRWHADWWGNLAEHGDGLSPEDREGVAAYARKQANVRRLMGRSFDHLWRTEWLGILEGEGHDNELLELEPNSMSFITSYPSSRHTV